MQFLIVATVCLIASTAHAYCPNSCSGHGSCTTNPKDSCVCYQRAEVQSPNGGKTSTPDWTGADCSLRTCPSYEAAASSPSGNNEKRTILECSGKGICDRKTGMCKCNSGFSGAACQNAVPEDQTCSNAGTLVSQKNLAAAYSCNNMQMRAQFNKHCTEGNSYTGAQYDTAFDSERQYGCLCDPGRQGPTCAEIACPSRGDVLSGEGAESGRECSGRGTCDTKTGTCECHPGYTGEDCTSQSTFV